MLSIITFGIYGIYWFICLSDDANAVAGTEDMSGGTAYLLTIVTFRIYILYWAYKQGEKIETARRNHGMPSGNQGALYLLLCLYALDIVAYALMQNELNALTAAA